MIDDEVVRAGLAALSVAVGEIMEAIVGDAVSALPSGHDDRLERFVALGQIGQDIQALAAAAQVLVRRGGAPG